MRMNAVEIHNKITDHGILITDTPIMVNNDTCVTLFKTKKGVIARIDKLDDVFTRIIDLPKEYRSLSESAVNCLLAAHVATQLEIRIGDPSSRYYNPSSFFGAYGQVSTESLTPEEEEDARAEFEERIANLRQNTSVEKCEDDCSPAR